MLVRVPPWIGPPQTTALLSFWDALCDADGRLEAAAAEAEAAQAELSAALSSGAPRQVRESPPSENPL